MYEIRRTRWSLFFSFFFFFLRTLSLSLNSLPSLSLSLLLLSLKTSSVVVSSVGSAVVAVVASSVVAFMPSSEGAVCVSFIQTSQPSRPSIRAQISIFVTHSLSLSLVAASRQSTAEIRRHCRLVSLAHAYICIIQCDPLVHALVSSNRNVASRQVDFCYRYLTE